MAEHTTEQRPFEVGDQVVLITGGPVMAVNGFRSAAHELDKVRKVECQWFAGKKLERGSFASKTLRYATDDDLKKK